MITFATPQLERSTIFSVGVKEIGPYYWVGQCKNGVDYYAGQTFKVPVNGFLKRIKLFSSLVHGNSDATLSIYRFDAASHTWKEKKTETLKRITKSLENQWLEFELPPVQVNKDESYGFKLTCSGGMLAIAECPWKKSNPYADGIEWVGSSHFPAGKFQKEFDFAFEADIETSANAKFF